MHWLAPRLGVLSLLSIVLLSCNSSAGEVDSPRALAQQIDRLIERQFPEGTGADLITESRFIRRVTLDLAGRIPTAWELQEFRQSESLDKRAELVERLIDSPDFAFHQRNELDNLLLRRLQHNDSWREYLLEATRENRSWARIFREVMSPEDACPEDLRPVAFLKQRVKDLDSMANDSSVIWFGVNVGCAKCHDHPLVDDWKQAHYYGLAAFFKRTFGTKKGFLSERFDGTLKYETTDGEQFDADFMYLTGAKVDATENPLDEKTLKEYREAIKKAERDANADPPPRPDFRPRSRLVDLALADSEQQFFARNIVNRTWARMFGRGLVHPLDQMHSENPPSHPELLELLSEDFAAHGYDLKRLIHAIALTDSYARPIRSIDSSDPYGEADFAVAVPRPLSPHQFSLSLLIATRNPEEFQGPASQDDWAERREALENRSEKVARRVEIPGDNFQVPVSEALWFSNNPEAQNDYLGPGRDRLVGYLAQIESDQQLVREATISILTRDPNPDEQAAITDYLKQRADRRVEAIQHVVWALLGSPEFRFNH